MGRRGALRRPVAAPRAARVLLSDRDVWILDEPTAAVDADAEAAIYQQLAELKGARTVIVISHRPETLKAVDRVVGFG